MKAIILAAGYATRLYPLTKNKSKALLEIAGKAMIDYISEALATISDIDELVVVTNHRFAKDFELWANDARARYPFSILVLDDQTTNNDNRLGAIGDIHFAIEQANLNDDLCILAGDNLFSWSLKDAYNVFRKSDRDLIVGQEIEDLDTLKRFAVAEVDDEMNLISLEEKPENPKSNIGIYACYFYKKDTLKLFQTYLDEGGNKDAPGHFPEWLYKRQEVKVYLFEGKSFDIGTIASYEEAQEVFKKA